MLERRQQLLRRLHASSKTKTDDFQRNSLLLKCDLKYKLLSAFFFQRHIRKIENSGVFNNNNFAENQYKTTKKGLN